MILIELSELINVIDEIVDNPSNYSKSNILSMINDNCSLYTFCHHNHMNTCQDCYHFIIKECTEYGSFKGSCELRNTSSYHDIRYGKNKPCKKFIKRKD